MNTVRYAADIPAWLEDFCAVAEMQRLKDVGMNCGCEYTSFPRFQGLPGYSRYRHSVGAAQIVWNFTGDMAQTLAALFHDISTPVFAHTIDFLHGDYLHQEFTEGQTEAMICGSAAIMRLLRQYHIAPEAVTDYHRYPVADNDRPRLSADRLEYTLGNLHGYGLCGSAVLQRYYDDICVAQAADGGTELAFRSLDTAAAFARDALKTARIFVADEDRYSMQMLAELLGRAVEKGVLTAEDLYGTEGRVIALLEADEELRGRWRRYRALHRMISDPSAAPEEHRRTIPAKKRYVDPLVCGQGRVSALIPDFCRELSDFLAAPQTQWLCAE